MIFIELSTVKTLYQNMSDGKPRKPEEQKGLDTLVVPAVNDVY